MPTTKSKTKYSNSSNQPQVYKVEDYEFFLECVEDGLWQNNSYLGELCSVSRETIAEWKKRPETIAARKIASKALRQDFKRRGDVEKRLKEAGMEVSPNTLDLTSGGKPLLGGASQNGVHSNNGDTKAVETE